MENIGLHHKISANDLVTITATLGIPSHNLSLCFARLMDQWMSRAEYYFSQCCMPCTYHKNKKKKL